MAAPSYYSMLIKELEENKELTTEQRLEILRRIGSLTDKKLTLSLTKIRSGIKPRPRHRERFERPAEFEIPVGQRIDNLLGEIQKEKESAQDAQSQEIGNNSGPQLKPGD